MERQIRSAKIGADGTVPLLGSEFVDRRPHAVDAGVGDCDVDPTKSLHEFGYRELHGVCRSDVRDESYRFPSVRFDGISCRSHFCGRITQGTNACAFLCQSKRRGSTDTRSDAGYQGNLSLEFHVISFLREFKAAVVLRASASPTPNPRRADLE